jgi:hypothetical protein
VLKGLTFGTPYPWEGCDASNCGYVHIYDGNTATFGDIDPPFAECEPGAGAVAGIDLGDDGRRAVSKIRYYGRSDKDPDDPIFERAIGALFQGSNTSIYEGFVTLGEVQVVEHSTWHEIILDENYGGFRYLRVYFPQEQSFGNLAEVEWYPAPDTLDPAPIDSSTVEYTSTSRSVNINWMHAPDDYGNPVKYYFYNENGEFVAETNTNSIIISDLKPETLYR